MTLHTRLLGAAAAIALLLPVAAQATEGFYLGVNAGVSVPGNSEVKSGATTNTIDFDNNYAGIFLGGYQFESNWRLEGEFAVRSNPVGDISGTGAATPSTGKYRAYSMMADAIYGIPTGTKFTPYLGAGLGVARVVAENVGTTLGTSVDDNDTVLAYQGIAGLEYDITPNFKAALDYRYFRTADPKFASAAATEVKSDYENHTITVGLRYVFPKAQAAVAPAAAPVVAAEAAPPAPPMVPNNYIVFFDFNRANLSAEADSIVATAAQNATQAHVTTIEVTGHADRSGSDKYNMRLSQRRADAIKQALVAKGIPADQITVFAKGESQPLVATADGVREAQNRRVQVVLK